MVISSIVIISKYHSAMIIGNSNLPGKRGKKSGEVIRDDVELGVPIRVHVRRREHFRGLYNIFPCKVIIIKAFFKDCEHFDHS